MLPLPFSINRWRCVNFGMYMARYFYAWQTKNIVKVREREKKRDRDENIRTKLVCSSDVGLTAVRSTQFVYNVAASLFQHPSLYASKYMFVYVCVCVCVCVYICMFQHPHVALNLIQDEREWYVAYGDKWGERRHGYRWMVTSRRQPTSNDLEKSRKSRDVVHSRICEYFSQWLRGVLYRFVLRQSDCCLRVCGIFQARCWSESPSRRNSSTKGNGEKWMI